MMMAFFPCPTSTCKNPGVSQSCLPVPTASSFEVLSNESRDVTLSEQVSCASRDKTLWSSFVELGLRGRLLLSYLACRSEGQGAEGGAHIGDVRFEVVKSICDVGLDFRRLLPRRAVRRDLVQCGVRHDG